MAIVVAIMYVDSATARINGKSYTRHLLRESYREGGKVKHRTIANISRGSPEEIEAIRLALRHKGDLAEAFAIRKSLSMSQGQSNRLTAKLTRLLSWTV